MPIINIDGKHYDSDTASPEAREQIEQLIFLSTDLAKMLVPAEELPAKIEASKHALARALIIQGDTIKLG